MLWNTKTYKGRYKVRNKEKYMGNPAQVVARSGWERSTFIWCEKNPNVLKWASENASVAYVNPIDKKTHKYILDLMIWWANGTISIIEIKPKYQTKVPVFPNRRTKRYINEVKEYAKNISKWESARRLAKSRGWKFEIWNEDVLKQKGVKIV